MYYYDDNVSVGEKWKTAFQAAAIWIIFFSLLFFSGQWHLGAPPLPAVAITLLDKPIAPPPSPSPPEEEFIPEPIPEPEPEVPPQPEEDTVADIIREQEEKKKKEEERKKREEEKKRQEEEQRKEQEKKKEEEKRRKKEEEEKRKREAAEEARRQAEEKARLEAEAAQRRQALESRLSRLRSKYIGLIGNRIDDFLKTPKSVPEDSGIVVILRVRLNPDGSLLELPEVIEPSGFPEYDSAAIKAVLHAAPLPIPSDRFIAEDPTLMREFLEHEITIFPQF